jgi:hypothetical protein
MLDRQNCFTKQAAGEALVQHAERSSRGEGCSYQRQAAKTASSSAYHNIMDLFVHCMRWHGSCVARSMHGILDCNLAGLMSLDNRRACLAGRQCLPRISFDKLGGSEAGAWCAECACRAHAAKLDLHSAALQ